MNTLNLDSATMQNKQSKSQMHPLLKCIDWQEVAYNKDGSFVAIDKNGHLFRADKNGYLVSVKRMPKAHRGNHWHLLGYWNGMTVVKATIPYAYIEDESDNWKCEIQPYDNDKLYDWLSKSEEFEYSAKGE